MNGSGILTEILGALVNGASQGFDNIRVSAESLFYKLIGIEVVLFGIGIALNRIDIQRELVAKVIAIGFVQFILFRYVWLVDVLRNSFVSAGLFAAGGNMSIPDFLDPSYFTSLGFEKVFTIMSGKFDQSLWTYLSTPSFVWVFYGATIILLFFAFVAIGLQIFLSVAEFYLVSSLAIILLPFLILSKTSFLGLRAINGLIAICIKLMVLGFVAGLSTPVLELLTITNGELTLKASMSLAIGALAIALLMWRAPAIAMSLISGTGGLDVGSSMFAPVLSSANLLSGTKNMISNTAKSGSKVLGSVKNAASGGR